MTPTSASTTIVCELGFTIDQPSRIPWYPCPHCNAVVSTLTTNWPDHVALHLIREHKDFKTDLNLSSIIYSSDIPVGKTQVQYKLSTATPESQESFNRRFRPRVLRSVCKLDPRETQVREF